MPLLDSIGVELAERLGQAPAEAFQIVPELGPEEGLMETSRGGVLAIGDVRCGSVKRVAAAVGEGAQVVAALHAYLARDGSPAVTPQSMIPKSGNRFSEQDHASTKRYFRRE